MTKEVMKQEQNEPVGKFAKFTDGIWREVTDGSAGVPLYTHPKKWVELTKKEYDDIYASNKDNIYRAMMVVATYLKRKNNTGENNLS